NCLSFDQKNNLRDSLLQGTAFWPYRWSFMTSAEFALWGSLRPQLYKLPVI
ncbi:MAG: hypothetical protein ACI8VR_000583, partial [Candidatus Azotimanducaceae bacterium]